MELMGALTKDEIGGFLTACNSYIPHVASAAIAEARALKDGLVPGVRLDVPRVLLSTLISWILFRQCMMAAPRLVRLGNL
jgi:hypothetical protein